MFIEESLSFMSSVSIGSFSIHIMSAAMMRIGTSWIMSTMADGMMPAGIPGVPLLSKADQCNTNNNQNKHNLFHPRSFKMN